MCNHSINIMSMTMALEGLKLLKRLEGKFKYVKVKNCPLSAYYKTYPLPYRGSLTNLLDQRNLQMDWNEYLNSTPMSQQNFFFGTLKLSIKKPLVTYLFDKQWASDGWVTWDFEGAETHCYYWVETALSIRVMLRLFHLLNTFEMMSR